MNFSITLILLLSLFGVGKSFVRIRDLAHLNATSTFTQIFSVRLSSSGQILHVSVNDSEGIIRIKKYNISTGSFVFIRNYTQTPQAKVIPKQIMLYSTYVIGIEPTKINFTVYLNNGNVVYRTVNQTVYETVQSASQGIVIYVATSGRIYWVWVADFPQGNYKNFIMQGIQGMSQSSLSPNANYIAIGSSTDNKVFLIELFNKTLLHVYTLNGTDTRALAWSSDSTKLYAATSAQGKAYEMSISSPFTVRQYRYELANIVTAYHIEFYQLLNEIAIWTYKTDRSNIHVYGLMLNDSTVFRKESYRHQSNVLGSEWDRGNGAVYCDWSDKQIWIKTVDLMCDSGYYYDKYLGVCSVDVVNGTSTGNITNTTSSTSPINDTNLNSPNTTNLNSPNITNTTHATNQTNSTTNPTNQSNVSLNNNSYIPPPKNSLNLPAIFQSFSQLLSNTINSIGVKTLNKIPGSRKILQPLFVYFGNLDDFWLYIYHERNYEFVFTSTLQAIHNIQIEKWRAIPYETLWDAFGLNIIKLKEFMSFKRHFSSQKFIDVEGNPNGFFVNTASFFLSNMILAILIFLILRFLFFLLFNYRISIFLRQYSFWPYLCVILLQGNLQYASFLAGFQFKWLFSHTFSSKILTVWFLIIFFCIFLFSMGAYFYFRYFYKRLSKYFFDSMSNSNKSAFHIMMHYGIRNILIGFLHSIDDSRYRQKIIGILVCEIFFLVLVIRTLGKRETIKEKLRVWMNITAGILKILVIGVLYFENDIENQGQITYTSILLVYAISVYIFVGILATMIAILKVFFGVIVIYQTQQTPKIKRQDNTSGSDQNVFSQPIRPDKLFEQLANNKQDEKNKKTKKSLKINSHNKFLQINNRLKIYVYRTKTQKTVTV